MKKSFLFLANGFEECEAITPIDILRRGGVEVVTVSVTGTNEVTSAHNIAVVADKLFDECDFSGADMLILPGGMPGAQHLNEHDGLKQLITRLAAQNKWITAICAAPLVLGGLGLLKGRKATCYPGFEDKLIGATYTAQPVEIDGNIITGRGPGYAFNFGFTLLAALTSTAVAQEVEAGMFP
jgi:4-methyl-5(b-hydroxyethyl)-thiazole monophosphate biosynthesis